MNKYISLKEKIKNCSLITMANVMAIQNPLMLRAFENADCVLLDKEHGCFGTEELIPMTMQCRAMGLPAIVRVEDTLYHLIAKAIDLGADGIMLPRVESVEQIKTAVEAMHFAPVGRTGFGGWGIMRDGESFEEFQSGRFLFPQIESPKGLAAMDEMIEKYGEFIDGFIVGPNDYSIVMGVPRQLDHPVMLEEYKKIFAVCKKYNKSVGIFDPDLYHATRDYKMGANIFWLSDDFNCMKDGFEQLRNKVLDLGKE